MRLGRVVAVFCGSVVLVGLLIAGSSALVSQRFETAQAESAVLVQALRNQMFADMMHDAVRGVVYRAAYAASSADTTMKAGLAEEEKSVSDAFVAAVQAQHGLALPSQLQAAIAGVNEPLMNYIAAAKQVVDEAVAGDVVGVQALLDDFEARFDELTVSMESVADQIELANAASAEHASAASATASLATIGGLSLITILSLSLILLSRRFLVKPMEALTTSMREMAGGALDQIIQHRQRVRELADMAGALSVFQQALQDRADLERQAGLAAARNTARMEQADC